MQRKITSSADLKQSIKELEARTKRQGELMKDELKSTAQSIKETVTPARLAKAGLNSLRHTPGMKTVAINTFIGLAAGYLTRRFIVGKSASILKRTLGAAVQAGITRLVHKKLPLFKSRMKATSNGMSNGTTRHHIDYNGRNI
jgi:hypothetical protein